MKKEQCWAVGLKSYQEAIVTCLTLLCTYVVSPPLCVTLEPAEAFTRSSYSLSLQGGVLSPLLSMGFPRGPELYTVQKGAGCFQAPLGEMCGKYEVGQLIS